MVLRAQSVLFYGLSIKTLSLCYAVDAHKATKGIQLALEIIKLRKRQGEIKVSILPTTVTRVPEEVWQLVKEQVMDQALLDAEQAILRPFCGPDEDPPSLEGPRYLGNEEAQRRDDFWNNFGDDDGAERLFKDRIKDIQDLLVLFGLVLPYNLPHGEMENTDSSFESFTAISLPLTVVTFEDPKPSTSYPVSTVTDQFKWYIGSMTALVQFSNSIFSLPADADARFKRFLKTCNIKAQDPIPPIVFPPSGQSLGQPSPDTSMNKRRLVGMRYREREAWKMAVFRKSHEAVCCSNPVVKPHWSMLTVIEEMSDRDL